MRLPHLLPFDSNSIVFLTVCTRERRPVLADSRVHSILREIWTQSAQRNGWYVGHYVLMPDHAHLFACRRREARSLADWVRIWKSLSAAQVKRATPLEGGLWQTDYFDRFLRSLDDYQQKWEYVAMNPVRKRLVETPEAWPYRGTIHDLRHHASRG